MDIVVRGIGWLTREGYGSAGNGLRHVFESGEDLLTLSKNDFFSHPFKNFGRLDAISRLTAYAVSLALRDAGIEYSPQRKQDIGIVGTNAEGSLQSDIEYFRDYLEGGRTLSRGNLFIYTLPSSPIGEAAIHFGLVGPVLYAASEHNALASALGSAGEMILAKDALVMLAGAVEADAALFFVLAKAADPGQPVPCGFDEARSLVQTNPDLPGLIQKILRMAPGKG